MSCACHRPDGNRSVEGKTLPDSQCTTCALKHVEMAIEAWGEFLYEEENRRWCARHLRLAVEHLKLDHREEALKCREMANVIELALDKDRNEAHDRLQTLYQTILGLFKADQPEYVKRLEKLKMLEVMREDSMKDESLEKKQEESSIVPLPNSTPEMDGGTKELSFSLPETRAKSTLSSIPEETASDLTSIPLSQYNMMGEKIDRGTDIIIPLGPGSKSNDDELKILLRSIDTNCSGLRRIILATKHVPEWLNRSEFTIVPLDDPEAHLKDANLIYKTLEVIKRCKVQSFVWCADDNVFMKEVKLDEIPRLHNPRGRNDFDPSRTWCKRVINTFDYFKHQGIKLTYNFETHTPQYFSDAQKLLKEMSEIEYREQPGLTIMTAFYCCIGDIEKGFKQQDYKETFESAESVKSVKFDKLYVGYNDKAFIDGGLKDKLFEVFNKKSRYEL